MGPWRALQRFARARAVHFLLLGGIIFALSHAEPRQSLAVELSAAEIAALQRQSGQDASALAGATAIRQRVIEDAVLVAEARRLGMDRDEIVRARLVQKQLFLAEELAGASRVPTEAELRAYFAAHRGEHERPASCVFTHVFAKTAQSAAGLLEPVRRWAETAPAEAIAPFGDAFPLSRRVHGSAASLAQSFGAEFTAALANAPVGRWAGPFRSQYGYHLVRLQTFTPARPAPYEEVRSELRLKLLIERREQAVAAYLRGLLRRYRVTIDGEPVAPHDPVPRTAPRSADSAEDR